MWGAYQDTLFLPLIGSNLVHAICIGMHWEFMFILARPGSRDKQLSLPFYSARKDDNHIALQLPGLCHP